MAGMEDDRSAGRPRDASIDERALTVARELLVEMGWEGLSMRLIAARSGVSRSSLDRRWPSKAELVLHVILGATPDLTPFAGTDRTGWVDWVARGSRELFTRPEVRAAVPGLLLAMAESPDLRRRIWSEFSGPAVALFVGTQPGDAPDAADAADATDAERDARALLAMGVGAALLLTTVAVEDDTEALHARIVDILTTAVASLERTR
jgi:AcrR family transcriptional regulator